MTRSTKPIVPARRLGADACTFAFDMRRFRPAMPVLLMLLASAAAGAPGDTSDRRHLGPPPLADGSLDVRVWRIRGTAHPHRLLRAFESHGVLVGQSLCWDIVPDARARDRRRTLRLLARNCGHRPTIDGNVAWCELAIVESAPWAHELAALESHLWNLPLPDALGPRRYSFDGTTIGVELTRGSRQHAAEYHDPRGCDHAPCRVMERVESLFD